MYYYIGEIGQLTLIFGEGNTRRTAEAAGEPNATEHNARNCRTVNKAKLPKHAKWWDATTEY